METLCNKGIRRVGCGTHFSVVLANDGHVYTFGQGTKQKSALKLCLLQSQGSNHYFSIVLSDVIVSIVTAYSESLMAYGAYNRMCV